MSVLPPGWVWTDTASVAEVQGGIQKQPKRAPRSNRYPFLRVANVLRGRLDLQQIHEVELFGGELDKFRLHHGDLLVVEGNGSPNQIGRAALWRGEIENCVHQNHLIRVRPTIAIDPNYLTYYWNASRTTEYLRSVASSTSGLYVLTAAKVRGVRLPLPPLKEQGRIVAAIEEQFSRVDAGAAAVDAAQWNLGRLRSSVLASILFDPSGADWATVELGEVLVGGRYGTSTKCSYDAPGLPVLRIPNIQSRTISLRDLKRAVDPAVDLTRALTAPGDVLMIRTNGSRSLIGRAAVVPALPHPTAFASYLIQLRVDSDTLNPAYLVAALSSPRLRAAIERVAATTAGQYNINLEKLRSIRIPLPPLAEQAGLMAETERWLSTIHAMDSELMRVSTMAVRLRSSILAAAFAGELVAQDHGDEPASVLLERIGRERSGSNDHGRKDDATHRKKATT